MKEKITKFLRVLLVMATVVVFVSGFLALPTMYLWNWLMPNIFGLIEINAIQSFGILTLSNILFNLDI